MRYLQLLVLHPYSSGFYRVLLHDDAAPAPMPDAAEDQADPQGYLSTEELASLRYDMHRELDRVERRIRRRARGHAPHCKAG